VVIVVIIIEFLEEILMITELVSKLRSTVSV
jgi:hypothetical protein